MPPRPSPRRYLTSPFSLPEDPPTTNRRVQRQPKRQMYTVPKRRSRQPSRIHFPKIANEKQRPALHYSRQDALSPENGTKENRKEI